MPLAEARRQLSALMKPHGRRETLELDQVLPGRLLAAPLIAVLPLPGAETSAMDGYAIRWHDVFMTQDGKALQETTLEVIGTSRPGHPWQGALPGQDQCIRIFTGAVMPSNCDTVIMQEQAHKHDDASVTLHMNDSHMGENVRHMGEECLPGDVILASGHRIKASEIGMFAAHGLTTLEVFCPLKVSIMTTGDELRYPGALLEKGQIYDSNRYTLKAMLRSAGCEVSDLGILEDDPEIIYTSIMEASCHSDVIITTGGVSVGEHDYVKPALEKAGELSIWKLAMKPGRPLTYGRIKNCHFFGLPGNPAAVMTGFTQIILPALRRLEGETLPPIPLSMPARSLVKLGKRPGRTEFLRGIARQADDGTLEVTPTGHQGSGMLRSFSQANCFIVLAAESKGAQKGDTIEIQPFHGCMS